MLPSLPVSDSLVIFMGARTHVTRTMLRPGVTSASSGRLAHRLNLWKLFHHKLARGQRVWADA
jgi:hypothetical protein